MPGHIIIVRCRSQPEESDFHHSLAVQNYDLLLTVTFLH